MALWSLVVVQATLINMAPAEAQLLDINMATGGGSESRHPCALWWQHGAWMSNTVPGWGRNTMAPGTSRPHTSAYSLAFSLHMLCLFPWHMNRTIFFSLQFLYHIFAHYNGTCLCMPSSSWGCEEPGRIVWFFPLPGPWGRRWECGCLHSASWTVIFKTMKYHGFILYRFSY